MVEHRHGAVSIDCPVGKIVVIGATAPSTDLTLKRQRPFAATLRLR